MTIRDPGHPSQRAIGGNEHALLAPAPSGDPVLQRLIDAVESLVFGSEPRLRARLRLILVAAAVYALSLLAQWTAVTQGLADPPPRQGG